MEYEISFCIEQPSLEACYDAIVSSTQFKTLASLCQLCYWSLECIDTDENTNTCSETDDGQNPEKANEFCGVNVRAMATAAPFADDWKRIELWGYHCDTEGITNGTYGFEVIAQFDGCKVIVPHTTDYNLRENVLEWWNFPCTRLNGSAIFARNIIFLFGSE